MAGIADFLQAARNGDEVDASVFVNFTRRFEAIVLWGAGNLGTAVGKRLLELDIRISAYWDMRAEQIVKQNAVDVLPLFSGDFIPENTLVIVCIGNAPLRINNKNLVKPLSENGWHFMDGMDLLYALICPLSSRRPLNARYCTNFGDICSLCECARLHNIVLTDTARKRKVSTKDIFFIERVHFIVNNLCNLKCTHCCVYINSIPRERKQNIDFQQIQQDISLCMQSVDAFGSAILLGGEPFLHKDIDRIIVKILSYDKFGILLINTNGIPRMSQKQFDAMKDPRVNLSFSNYLHVLDEKKSAAYLENCKNAADAGVNIGRLARMPVWNLSPTLENFHYDAEQMIRIKSACNNRDFLYVYDGKIFPCTTSYSIFDLGIADYKTDYILLDPEDSPEENRNKIINLRNRPYYHACSHCSSNSGLTRFTPEVAKQGFDPRYPSPNRNAREKS
jgi:hypothetical protein